jgi:hypothetical protein
MLKNGFRKNTCSEIAGDLQPSYQGARNGTSNANEKNYFSLNDIGVQLWDSKNEKKKEQV